MNRNIAIPFAFGRETNKVPIETFENFEVAESRSLRTRHVGFLANSARGTRVDKSTSLIGEFEVTENGRRRGCLGVHLNF
jgi:hypothetical protein